MALIAIPMFFLVFAILIGILFFRLLRKQIKNGGVSNWVWWLVILIIAVLVYVLYFSPAAMMNK